jgi:hypothetical protein
VASPGKKAFLMRVEPELWAELERLAATELRSVNGQIEYLLREAVNRRKGKKAAPKVTQQRVLRMRRRTGSAGQ